VRTWWDVLRTSLWFVPSLMGLGAFGLVALTMAVERNLVGPSSRAWFLYAAAPADAHAVLATILSSMITMASLVFSITMVVLTLAASQFGPRLIRNFMANPQTQFVLGTFVMTIVYCLVVLPTLDFRASLEPRAYVSVNVALALTVLSTGLLVLFLHTLARSIVSETVIERVGNELDALLEELEPIGATDDAPGISLPPDFEERSALLPTGATGYVQAVRFGHLAAAAEKADALIVLYFRPGHYVVDGSREIAVYPAQALDASLAAQIRGAILTGAHRTPTQDPDFAIRHLDEIADRALSAAVNDPYTAVAVIDRLSASLCKLMGKALPDGGIRDAGGHLRVASTPATYAGLLQASFNQIRQNGADKPIIVLHLLEAIGRIAEHVRTRDQYEALTEQLQVIMAGARRALHDGFDRDKVEERYRDVSRILDRSARAKGLDAGLLASNGAAESSSRAR